MAKSGTTLTVEIEDVAEPLGPEDELLTPAEAAIISLFTPPNIERPPNFGKLPENSVWLRRARPGRAICTQGEAGATAFFILDSDDVLRLRELQLRSIRQVREAQDGGQDATGIHKYFALLSERQLERREQEIVDEIEVLKERSAELERAGGRPNDESTDYRHPTQVATANLLINRAAGRKRRGLLRRLTRSLFARADAKRQPDYIPIDGPTDINARTLQAPLHEGDLLGEMSCMNRAPRSATVLVGRDCYLVEMIRNVLDFLHKDKRFKTRMDEIYRQRVLEIHIRNLSIFEDLSDEQFSQLQNSIELVEYESGSVIFEEHEPSDCFYIIRSGLIKVVSNAWCLLRDQEFKGDEWGALSAELLACSQSDSDLASFIWSALAPEAQAIVGDHAGGKPVGGDEKRILLQALNNVIRRQDLPKSFGKTTRKAVAKVDSPQLRTDAVHYPDRWNSWSDLEFRSYFRLALEQLCPAGIPRRGATTGVRQTLSYLGRGDCFGEMGVINPGIDELTPRSATCYAYDHPDGGADMRIADSRTGSVPSRVELARIDKQVFHELLRSSKRMRVRVERIIDTRTKRSERESKKTASQIASLSRHSADFEQLGLVQGQRLMLIDLERCTRCNACVEACVTTHDDGRTRLYLDGPRFENYLVPLTCRSCRDPVCLIGCPVGAINRGDRGEIQIEDWCIGCKKCADQCPYGAIQMNEFESPAALVGAAKDLVAGSSKLQIETERAVVCDLCSSLGSGEPSCVYACPHDAAMRIDAREFFLEGAIQ